jgi:YVTN family beta-propeller protein
VCNYLSNTVSRISLRDNTLIATLSLGGGARPASVIYSLDGTKAFVSLAGLGTNLIAQITMSSFTVTNSLSATLPSSLVLSPNGDRAYTTAATSPYVTYFSTSTLASGSISLTGYSGAAATSLAVSPDGATVYAVRGNNNIVSILNAVALTEASITVVGTSPREVTVSPDGSKVYVTNNGGGNVSVLNAAGAVTGTITVGSGPNQVAFTPDGSYALVTNSTSNTVSFIDTATSTVEATVTVGADPRGLAITPLGTKALVLNYSAGTVSIINAPVREIVGGPTAALQQYGIREGGTCGVGAPDSVLLPAFGDSVRNSGWGSSWAQWPNGGRGGYVCTRQPLYTTSGWLLAP